LVRERGRQKKEPRTGGKIGGGKRKNPKTEKKNTEGDKNREINPEKEESQRGESQNRERAKKIQETERGERTKKPGEAEKKKPRKQRQKQATNPEYQH
jgi:hypothetical protein